MYFGYGSPANVRAVQDVVRLAEQADRDGLDLFSLSDHPYVPNLLDAYATLAFLLGRTTRISALGERHQSPAPPSANARPYCVRPDRRLERQVRARSGSGRRTGPDRDDGGHAQAPGGSGRGVRAGDDPDPQALRRWPGCHRPVLRCDRARAVAARGSTDLDRLRRPEVPGRDGTPGRRLDPRPRSRLAQRGLPVLPRDHRRGSLEVGRKPADIATIYNRPGTITQTPLAKTRDDEGNWLGGSPAQWIEELTSAVIDHGTGGFILFPSGPETVDLTLSRWAHEVVPAVREATQM